MTDDSNSTPDLISELPNNVMENILMHLPLRDAVKTSVLSKKWRHSWETLPLVFDSTFVMNLKEQLPTKNELLLTIYQVLLLHRGPILKFTLSISELESCPQIDHIVQFLSRNGIQELTLCFPRDEHYKVPSCLFSCLELRHLHLSSCLFKPPATFHRFNRLISVNFEDVNFDADVIKNFFMKFPLLETLTIKGCSNIDRLDIYAPNLKLLDIGAAFESIYFRDTPLLATASIKGSGSQVPIVKRGCTVDMLEVFGSLPRIEYLYIGFYFLMILAAGNIPKMLSTNFNHLKTLVFHQICFNLVAEVSCALCLIRSSPYLRKLEIDVYHATSGDMDAVVELLEDQNHSDISLFQLQEVKMLSFKGTRSEMEFVKVLLAKSPLLERMHIQMPKTINTNDELRVLKEMTRFRRASAVAEIIYSGPNKVCKCGNEDHV